MSVPKTAAGAQACGASYPANAEKHAAFPGKLTPEKLPVLAVLRDSADALAMASMLERAPSSLAIVSCYRAAMKHVRTRRTPVIVTDERLPDGDWMDILSGIAPILNPPRVIVASPAADSRLWSEVLHLGAYDMLVKPFQQQEVVRAVESAQRAWREACEPRLKGVQREDWSAAHPVRARAASGGV
jgi:DNA-binding NtrC family response regulator